MKRTAWRLTASFFAVALTLAASKASPALEILTGTKDIKLVQQDGTEHLVGKIRFEAGDNGARYQIAWQSDVFSDHFLSMRPFKCMEGQSKHWCRVPYPYENKREISSGDLTDLEYDLLFVWKGATEYGINLWNGVYYKLQAEEHKLIGALLEIDMNLLAVPPENGNLRPVRQQDLEPGDPESHWLPTLIIE